MEPSQERALEAVQNTAVSLTILSRQVRNLLLLSAQLATQLQELEAVVTAESQVLMEQSSLTPEKAEDLSTEDSQDLDL
jgi:hypothetical protein